MSSCSFVWRNLRGICRYSLFTKKNDLDLVVNFKYATSRNANTKRPSNCVNHKNDDNVKHHAENVSSPNDLVEMDKKRGVSTKMPETLERIGGDGLLRIGDSCHRSKKVSNRNKYG